MSTIFQPQPKLTVEFSFIWRTLRTHMIWRTIFELSQSTWEIGFEQSTTYFIDRQDLAIAGDMMSTYPNLPSTISGKKWSMLSSWVGIERHCSMHWTNGCLPSTLKMLWPFSFGSFDIYNLKVDYFYILKRRKCIQWFLGKWAITKQINSD